MPLELKKSYKSGERVNYPHTFYGVVTHNYHDLWGVECYNLQDEFQWRVTGMLNGRDAVEVWVNNIECPFGDCP